MGDMGNQISIGTDSDPFCVPVDIGPSGCKFRLQVHVLVAKCSALGKGPTEAQLADSIRAVAMPKGAADGASQEELIAVYWQAMKIVQKATEQGNG